KDGTVLNQVKITVQNEMHKESIRTAAIMMENNKEIERKDAKVTVKKLENGKYEYSTYITLTDEEVNLLKNNKVFAALIYTFDTRVKNGELFKDLVNCVDNKK